MSNTNEDIQPKQPKDLVNIDETGKVVINSIELAKMTEELSLEELEAVSGGTDIDVICPSTTNPGCNLVAGCGGGGKKAALE
ncbi:hypothetical protein [Nostoc sp. LEGE 12450]|uniref:hypothetical protein n=1 Tax=Nostoc sp. LEGE 12450 TaxID=1828643 RepID=UPI001881AD22|nr:hypothetical protein [Nostoc sp. LEGE 12450]MBE8991622.1 hypothetical protein [Nostoc sp. LEGE 12450]